MSLLLEALKKAALEKQNRAEAPAESAAPVEATTEAPAEQAIVDQNTVEETDTLFDGSNTLSHDSDVTAVEEPEWDDLEFEEEFEAEPENLIFEEEPTEPDEPQADQPVLSETQKKLIQDSEELSLEEQEAARQLEAQRKALQTQEAELLAIQEEERQQRAEQEEQQRQREAELQEQALKEQQLRDQQFEEQERRDQEHREAEEKRTQEEQQAVSAHKERQALDQLIASGQKIAKRSRRRAAFLYVMLIFTAAGGILSYYFFLSAGSGIVELQTQTPVTADEPAINIEEIIQSNELAETSSSATDADDLDIEATIDSTPIAQSPSTDPQATVTAPVASSNVAERIDPPPSATAYLRPLITSEQSGRQTTSVAERVIIHHEPKSDEVSELVQQAYAAHKAQNHAQAVQLYSRALSIDPNHRDALLGAASSAAAQGNYSEATSLYQKRLNANPLDEYARAGLLGLMNSGESRTTVQREIGAMLEANPASAHLHFLKGVGLAANQQWQTAQSAFYEAFRIDNTNPDYAFNLAVSLDHLQQRPLARVYYERALSLAEDHAANFNQLAANRRLRELTDEQ